jgi:ABC-type transport system substrate-binding protein
VSVAVGLVLVVVATLAACSKKGGEGDDGSQPSAAFRAAVVRPASLDPSKARTIDELLVVDQLFDSLTAYDPKTLEPVPSLAASFTASDDQLHWDFTLRPTARFSDGVKVTAADVKATLDRIARKDSGSSVADLLELVAGYRAVAVDGTATDLAGVVVTSESVVRIDLDSPWSVLPSVLANPAFGVLPKAMIDAGAIPAEPVTSGPFEIGSLVDDRLTLVPANGVTAKSKRIEFVLVADKAAGYDALVAGRADWSEVPPDRLVEAGKRFGRSLFKPYVAELFYAFNLRDPKFADVRVREAIVRAIDRAAIIRDVYDGSVRPMDGLIVEGLAAHQDDPCGGRCGFDVERSKALLAELAAEGVVVPEIQIDFDDDVTQTAVATAIQKDLAAVGITAALRPKPLAEYQQFAVSGGQELFRLGWIAPYPSPDGVLAPLFVSGFPNNLTGFSVAAVDEQLAASRAAGDGARRTELYRSAEKAVLAELPIIPIAQFEVQSVASDRVRDLVVTSSGSFDARRVWVAAAS